MTSLLSQHGGGVWAMRSRRFLGDALTRRSAALRVEPSAKSQSKTAAAIAIDAAFSEPLRRPTGEAGASNLSTLPITLFWIILFVGVML